MSLNIGLCGYVGHGDAVSYATEQLWTNLPFAGLLVGSPSGRPGTRLLSADGKGRKCYHGACTKMGNVFASDMDLVVGVGRCWPDTLAYTVAWERRRPFILLGHPEVGLNANAYWWRYAALGLVCHASVLGYFAQRRRPQLQCWPVPWPDISVTDTDYERLWQLFLFTQERYDAGAFTAHAEADAALAGRDEADR